MRSDSSMKKKGTFIVIDGTDGSGKATQVGLLVERLRKAGRTVQLADFPEYERNFFGKLVGEALTDSAYDFARVHPKIASLLYAADRFESKATIEGWLAKGDIVIANRYVSSNQIHQGGKISSPKERKEFLSWLDQMEHGVFGIPRPDMVLYLSVPTAVSRALIEKRDKESVRGYKGAKRDAHESDPAHLDNARKSALKLVKELNNFVQIDCAKRNAILPIADIHEKIYQTVMPLLKK